MILLLQKGTCYKKAVFFGGAYFPWNIFKLTFLIHDHPCYFSRTFTSYLVPLGFGYGWSHESNLPAKKTVGDIPFSSSHGVKDFRGARL